MPALGKEMERQLTPDEIALREVQGYIDKVEHQAETQQPQINKPTAVQIGVQTPVSVGVKIPSGSQASAAQKITLPLDQVEVENGLKSNMLNGLRWLSEWCVMMIKKYPGRVFYMPTKQTND